MKKGLEICHYCEEPTKNPTKDHIYPISKIRRHREKGEPMPEGFDQHSNKVIACGACNSLKANKSYHSFKALGVNAIRHMKRQFLNNRMKNKKKRVIRKYRKS